MKPHVLVAALLFSVCLASGKTLSQTVNRTDTASQKKANQRRANARQRQVAITLKTGEMIRGVLVKVDPDVIEFTVRNILQAVDLDKVASIQFQDDQEGKSSTPKPVVLSSPSQVVSPPLAPAQIATSPVQSAPISSDTAKDANKASETIEESGRNGASKPIILYKEKAQYTREARQNGVQGAVVLSAIFTADGRIAGIRVIRGLPHGLTEKAIEAAQKIRFQPATKDGVPVSVRANLEFTFSLYAPLPAPTQLSPSDDTVFDHYPRKVVLQWTPVPGAVKYTVRIEWGDPNRRQWFLDREIAVTDPTYTFDFAGAQPGRWQVWAVDANGHEGLKTGWRVFRFTK